MQVFIVAVVLIALAFAGIAIKILVKKDGQFSKSCSTIDPATGQRLGCTCGNEDSGATCDNRS